MALHFAAENGHFRPANLLLEFGAKTNMDPDAVVYSPFLRSRLNDLLATQGFKPGLVPRFDQSFIKECKREICIGAWSPLAFPAVPTLTGTLPSGAVLVSHSTSCSFDVIRALWRCDDDSFELVPRLGENCRAIIKLMAYLLWSGLEPGTPPDPRMYSWTALHVAAHRGHADIVQLLLDHGASLDARARGCCDCNPREQDWTLGSGMLTSLPAVEALAWAVNHFAICGGNEAVFKSIFCKSPCREAENEINAYFLLRYVAWYGRLEICRFLIEDQKYSTMLMDGRLKDGNKIPIIFFAADRGHLSTVGRYLVGQGAEANPPAVSNATLLMHGLIKKHLDDVHRFLDLMPDPKQLVGRGNPCAAYFFSPHTVPIGFERLLRDRQDERLDRLFSRSSPWIDIKTSKHARHRCFGILIGDEPNPRNDRQTDDEAEDAVLGMLDRLFTLDHEFTHGVTILKCLAMAALSRSFPKVFTLAMSRIGSKRPFTAKRLAYLIERASGIATTKKGVDLVKVLLSYDDPKDPSNFTFNRVFKQDNGCCLRDPDIMKLRLHVAGLLLEHMVRQKRAYRPIQLFIDALTHACHPGGYEACLLVARLGVEKYLKGSHLDLLMKQALFPPVGQFEIGRHCDSILDNTQLPEWILGIADRLGVKDNLVRSMDLNFLAQRGQFRVVKLLFEHGADATSKLKTRINQTAAGVTIYATSTARPIYYGDVTSIAHSVCSMIERDGALDLLKCLLERLSPDESNVLVNYCQVDRSQPTEPRSFITAALELANYKSEQGNGGAATEVAALRLLLSHGAEVHALLETFVSTNLDAVEEGLAVNSRRGVGNKRPLDWMLASGLHWRYVVMGGNSHRQSPVVRAIANKKVDLFKLMISAHGSNPTSFWPDMKSIYIVAACGGRVCQDPAVVYYGVPCPVMLQAVLNLVGVKDINFISGTGIKSSSLYLRALLGRLLPRVLPQPLAAPRHKDGPDCSCVRTGRENNLSECVQILLRHGANWMIKNPPGIQQAIVPPNIQLAQPAANPQTVQVFQPPGNPQTAQTGQHVFVTALAALKLLLAEESMRVVVHDERYHNIAALRKHIVLDWDDENSLPEDFNPFEMGDVKASRGTISTRTGL